MVVGGGPAGMTAALNLADQGFNCYLVEKTESLGGILNDMTWTLEGEKTADILKDLTGKIKKHKKIEVMTNAEVKESDQTTPILYAGRLPHGNACPDSGPARLIGTVSRLATNPPPQKTKGPRTAPLRLGD